MLGLVNPKSVLSRYDTRNIKEVLSPLQVAEHNHVGADPHYCALTSNLQVRNDYAAHVIHDSHHILHFVLVQAIVGNSYEC